MGGALLNLSAIGPENVLLFEQPQYSYWHGTWKHFANFGIQTFRIDFKGQPALQDATSTRLRFHIPRNGDLLTQTYVSVDLPNIYSSIPNAVGPEGNPIYYEGDDNTGPDPITYQPYEFQWNDKPGFSLVEEVEIYIGGHLMDRYSGEQLVMSQERDDDAKQDELLDQMIGNVDELTNPAKAAFAEMQQHHTAAYDVDYSDNIMMTRMAQGGQMMYSGIGGGSPLTYLTADDYTGGVASVSDYPPYVLNSYPHSWPWTDATATPSAWTAQSPFPYRLLPQSKDVDNCSINNTPSIRGRQLIIPLNPWFGRNSKAALPLVALQYSDVEIFVTIRPLNQWFTVMKYMPPDGAHVNGPQGPYTIGTGTSWSATTCNPPPANPGYTGTADELSQGEELWPIGFPQRVAPQFGGHYDYNTAHVDGSPLHRFDPQYYTPDPVNLAVFLSPLQNWDPNIHIIANYVTLDEEEAAFYAQDEQTYMVRTTHEFTFYGVRTSDSVDIETSGLVGSLTWRFRRSDADQRNQWFNYTNWRYLDQPNVMPMLLRSLGFLVRQQAPSAYAENNERAILQELSIWVDGKERETTYARGVWEWMQKYQRSNSGFKAIPGTDFYTFEVKTNPFSIQPSGAFNMSKHRRLTLMFSLLQPPLDPNFTNSMAAGETTSVALPGGGSQAVCLPVFNNSDLQRLAYNYDLNVHVEKFNMLVIMNGMGALSFTR